MPLDPRAQRLLTMMTAASPAERGRPTLQQRRQSLDKLMQFARADMSAVTASDGVLRGPAGDIRLRTYGDRQHDGDRLPGFVFFHGGGMVAGSIETHDRVAAALALTTGCRIVSVDYRLAPEHKFPAAIDDARAAVAFVARAGATIGVDTTRILVGGDSAGATLATLTCQQAVRHGTPDIIGQCLICPVLDFGGEAPSRREFAEGYLIDRDTLQADLADYLQEAMDPSDPLVSPLRAVDLRGQPPAIIHTAEYDPMRDEGHAYTERLRAAGVAVDHTCHAGMVHNFHAMGALLPQAQAVLDQIGAQVQQLTGATRTV